MELIAREAKRVSLLLFGSPDVLDDVDAVLTIEILSFANRRGSGITRAHKIAIQAIVQLSAHEGGIARALMADLNEYA